MYSPCGGGVMTEFGTPIHKWNSTILELVLYVVTRVSNRLSATLDAII